MFLLDLLALLGQLDQEPLSRHQLDPAAQLRQSDLSDLSDPLDPLGLLSPLGQEPSNRHQLDLLDLLGQELLSFLVFRLVREALRALLDQRSQVALYFLGLPSARELPVALVVLEAQLAPLVRLGQGLWAPHPHRTVPVPEMSDPLRRDDLGSEWIGLHQSLSLSFKRLFVRLVCHIGVQEGRHVIDLLFLPLLQQLAVAVGILDSDGVAHGE